MRRAKPVASALSRLIFNRTEISVNYCEDIVFFHDPDHFVAPAARQHLPWAVFPTLWNVVSGPAGRPSGGLLVASNCCWLSVASVRLSRRQSTRAFRPTRLQRGVGEREKRGLCLCISAVLHTLLRRLLVVAERIGLFIFLSEGPCGPAFASSASQIAATKLAYFLGNCTFQAIFCQRSSYIFKPRGAFRPSDGLFSCLRGAQAVCATPLFIEKDHHVLILHSHHSRLSCQLSLWFHCHSPHHELLPAQEALRYSQRAKGA